MVASRFVFGAPPDDVVRPILAVRTRKHEEFVQYFTLRTYMRPPLCLPYPTTPKQTTRKVGGKRTAHIMGIVTHGWMCSPRRTCSFNSISARGSGLSHMAGFCGVFVVRLPSRRIDLRPMSVFACVFLLVFLWP